MKKLITAAFLSLICLGLTMGHADAGWFCHKHCNKYSQTICCRPYNAFTPVCFGNITCTGCCPLVGSCPAPGWCGPGGRRGHSMAYGQLPVMDAGTGIAILPGQVPAMQPSLNAGISSATDVPPPVYPTGNGQNPAIGPIPGKFTGATQQPNAFSPESPR